jgi:hypothetical protein
LWCDKANLRRSRSASSASGGDRLQPFMRAMASPPFPTTSVAACSKRSAWRLLAQFGGKPSGHEGGFDEGPSSQRRAASLRLVWPVLAGVSAARRCRGLTPRRWQARASARGGAPAPGRRRYS